VLCKQISDLQDAVIFIQEPWTNGSRILGLNSKGSLLFRSCTENNPQTCIITKGLSAYCLPQYSSRDQTAVRVTYKNRHHERSIMVASVYMPIDQSPPSKELEDLIHYCYVKGLPLIIGADTNAHHFWWGSKECNHRGYTLREYLATTDLSVINQGCEPTFCVGNKQTVIDVTLASRCIMSEIFDWHAVPEDSVSDHRKISFALQQDRRTSIKRRNVRKTNWDTYQSELDMHIGLWLGSVHTPADIERELDKVNSAIIQSYETACPARKCSGRKKVPWWNHELSCLRKKANRAFHTAYRSRSDQDWLAESSALWMLDNMPLVFSSTSRVLSTIPQLCLC